MSEAKNTKKEEELLTNAPNELPPKFVAIIKDENGEISFNVKGVELDEAFLIVKKGSIKFEKIYENSLRGI